MALHPEVFRIGSATVYLGNAFPTGAGNWPPFQIGDIVWNTTTPVTGGVTFWSCSVASVAGTAGTWVAGPVYT
jgi:hypothetical protein